MEMRHADTPRGAYSDADLLPGGELSAFVAAVESGSVEGAADALQLTQSAATKRIQKLERRLGASVLHRGRRGVSPTPFGQTIYPLAKHALRTLAAVSEAADGRSEARAILSLSASFTIGECLLADWLAAFQVERPRAHPQLEVTSSSAVVSSVRERRAEIGFVEGVDSLEGLDAITVARDRLLVVVNARHPWARSRSVAPRDLLTQPYMTRERMLGARAVAEAALAAHGIELVPVFEAASLQSLKRAISDGGFTLVSALTIEHEQRAGTLVGLPVRRIDLTRDLRAICNPRRRPTVAARALWRWLDDNYQKSA